MPRRDEVSENFLGGEFSQCHISYMQSPLQLAVTSQLDKNDLVEQQTDKVKRLRGIGGFISGVGHGGVAQRFVCRRRPKEEGSRSVDG